MIVDERIQDCVHEALRAAAARDAHRILTVLHQLDPTEQRVAVSYARFICATVMWDAYPRGPKKAALLGTARTILETESWADLGDAAEVADFVASTWAPDGPTAGPLADDGLVRLFVCALNLLDEYRAKGERWWEYLAEIWLRLAALPQ